ncbi:MAG: transglycosylase domain-containing protein [Kofleriaceae bacterium]
MKFGTGTRARLAARRWMIPAIGAGLVVVLVLVGLLVIYPRAGASMVRDKVISKLGAKLGREVRLGTVEVTLGHAVIRDVEIRGDHDGAMPLVHIEKVEIDFDTLSSLVGKVELGAATIDGVTVTMKRHADGRDNVRDIVERLRGNGEAGAPTGGSNTMPTSITVTRGRLLADDAQTGATLIVGDGDATWRPGELHAQARNVTATTIAAPKASVAKLDIKKLTGEAPVLGIEGAELSLYKELALSGIGGTISSDPAQPGKYMIDLAGGYGGVPGTLWTAKGPLDPRAMTASIELEAKRFNLDRLAPILQRTPVVDYAGTSVDTKVRLDLAPTGAKFAGEFHLRGLNVGHPMLADKEVHDLDLSGKIAGSFDRTKGVLQLDQGDFVTRNVPFSITGIVARPRPGEAAVAVGEVPKRGPGGIQFLTGHFVIPPIECQRVLAAIPTEMAPYMSGYKLRGTFEVDLDVDIDWAKLDELKLGGHVGLRNCKVTDEPADSPRRLTKEFEHYVEVDQGKWHSFVVGPANEDFVPFEDISPFLVKSIMSTEDSAFYFHRGFITSEFRTALVNDLKAGGFKYGASSITMQMVKNVLLYREKTLARKLQELFLTWHVENTLSKDRILEIYFNVIEYGPGLYGIGPAAKHYFGKAPKDLTPVEAAFFSTILPAPKERYKQYCAGTLTKWTDDKIRRILGIMLKRDRLTQTEYDNAMATPLMFSKTEDGETEAECLTRTRRAIKNARSTNPLKR